MLFILACAPDPAPAADGLTLEPPHITAAEVACDPQDAIWRFGVDTDAWTGNGRLIWSTDGRYIEYHDIDSVVSAPDGTSDQLELVLGVVADRAFVIPDSTTFFNCAEPGLSAVLRVLGPEGEVVTDCRGFGGDQWGEWGLDYGCATALE